MNLQDTDSKRRILCIDGGGILGTFPAAFLAALEKHVEPPIGRYFDLIAGTSTGGIIAAGLALGLSANEILKFYEQDGPTIFAENGSPALRWVFRCFRSTRRLAVAKYNSAPLRKALTKALGEKKIGNADTRLILPAWNPEARCIHVYKTSHHPRLVFDYKVSVVDAVMATTSAPTYFQQHTSSDNVDLIDGGIWANNPIAVATVEAIALLGWAPNTLNILSLGCLDKLYTIPQNAGLMTLSCKAVELFMDGQQKGAMGMVKLLTGHGHDREAIYRVDHTVKTGRFPLDDASKIAQLRGIGYSRAREYLPKMKKVFLTSPAQEFAPCYHLDSETNS